MSVPPSFTVDSVHRIKTRYDAAATMDSDAMFAIFCFSVHSVM